METEIKDNEVCMIPTSNKKKSEKKLKIKTG